MALVPKESKTKPKEVHEAEKAKPQKPGEKKSGEAQPRLKPLRDPVEAAKARLAEQGKPAPPKGGKDGKAMPTGSPGLKKDGRGTGTHTGTSPAGSKASGGGTGTLIPAKLTGNTPRYSTPNGLPPGVAGPPVPRPAPVPIPRPVAATTGGLGSLLPGYVTFEPKALSPSPNMVPPAFKGPFSNAGYYVETAFGLLGKGVKWAARGVGTGAALGAEVALIPFVLGGDSVQHPPSTGMPTHPQQPGSNVTTTPRNNYPFGVNGHSIFPRTPNTGPTNTGMPQTKLPDFGVQPIPLESLPTSNILTSGTPGNKYETYKGTLTNAGLARAVADIRKGKDVDVSSIEQARQILGAMPELRPWIEDRIMPNPDKGSGQGFGMPKATYKGDLINKNALGADVHPGLDNSDHGQNPHYNIKLPNGKEPTIVIRVGNPDIKYPKVIYPDIKPNFSGK